MRRQRMTTGKPRWRKSLVVAASLVLHLAVLGPLALARLGDEPPPDLHPLWSDPIEVVLLPRLPGEASRGRATSTPSGPSVPTPVTEVGPSRRPALFRSGPVDPPSPQPPPSPALPQSTGPSVAAGPIDGIPDPWRVRPGTTASGPGPAPLNCRRAELLPPIEREVCAARYAAAETRLGQRRLSRSESRRESGFVEQAAANEAWAAYRRSEDDGESYPGLRSMLKHF